MKTKTRIAVIALATAAAAGFMTAPIAAADDAPGASLGRCVGANACKGRSSCKTAHNACKGQNACKSQGFVTLTKAQCDQVGGNFEPQQTK